MRMMLAILIMSMSLTLPYSRVRKLWITMRKNKKRSKLSTKMGKLSTESKLSIKRKLSHQQIQVYQMTMKWVLKLIPSSLSFLRHSMNPKPKASIFQCLKEPSYTKILKDLCRQAHKSRNHRPNKIFPSKQISFLRWQNILLECYIRLKKKW